jgi:hypothetical protein
MRFQILLRLLLGIALVTQCIAAEEQRSQQIDEAARHLREARILCDRDAGTLWGKSLCGPLLLVNPGTREVFANQADAEHQLQKQGDLYTGKLPAAVNIANTATEWAGVKWTMVMLPLPEEPHRRAALLAHEMWHRVQDQLGFASSGAANDHLDSRDGRYWLQLELRALAVALAATGEPETNAIIDAAIFRARRRQVFPNAAAEERSMEMHEGLAEYTGVRLSGAADLRQFAIDGDLKEAAAKETFVRSFAYATGPAYGLLLDGTGAAWRKNLRASDDLAALLLKIRNLSLSDDLGNAATQRANVYGAAELAAAEDERERNRQEQEKIYRARLVDGPVVVIPLRKMNMQFDPRNLVPIAGHGTVYPSIRIVDEWGILEVKERGALMSADFSKINIPAPHETQGQKLQGEGWTLELKQDWELRPTERDGSYILAERDRK